MFMVSRDLGNISVHHLNEGLDLWCYRLPVYLNLLPQRPRGSVLFDDEMIQVANSQPMDRFIRTKTGSLVKP